MSPITPPHVLHVIDSLGLGGAERMLVDLANATAEAGQRVSVCATRSAGPLARELRPDVELLVLDRTRRISPRAFARLAAWARARGVDVLHVHMRSSLMLVLALRALRVLRLPIVFHDHYGSIEIDRAVPLWFRIGQRAIGRYVGVHERLTEWAREAGMSAARTTTIENGLDLGRLSAAPPADLRAELGVAPPVRLGLLVASFKREKGIDHLIAAVARMARRDRVRIAVAGGGERSAYADECRAAAHAHGLDAQIAFLGARTDVPSILRGVDFAVLASHSESGPLVLIEYLAAGLPIVATRTGNIGHRLADAGVPGFVPPGDVAALARALDEVVAAGPAELRARGQIGQRVLAAEWDIRAALPRWLDAYRGAMEAA